MHVKPTALLLDLAACARGLGDPGALHVILTEAHRVRSECIAEFRLAIVDVTCRLTDLQVNERCVSANARLRPGATREEAVTALAVSAWGTTLAAAAFTDLEEYAAVLGVGPVSELDPWDGEAAGLATFGPL